MFVEFDYKGDNMVYVKFSGTVQDESEIDYFLDRWRDLYNAKHFFSFVFDTTDMGMVNPKYCFKISKFIKSLKQEKIQYLTHSIMIVNNWYIKYLLKLVFAYEPPVAPVYLTHVKQDVFIQYANTLAINCKKLPKCVEILYP